MRCQYYRDFKTRKGILRKHCSHEAVLQLPSGAMTCGRHERKSPAKTHADKQLALDVVEIAHGLGVGRLSFTDWLRLFEPEAADRAYRGHVLAPNELRRFERWKARLRALGFAPKHGHVRYTALGQAGEFTFDLPRAAAWAQATLGESGQRPARRQNVPSQDEILSGSGGRSMDDYRAGPDLDGISVQVLSALADQQVPLTARQLGEEIRRGGRSRTVVSPHAAKRPCGTCNTEHGLRPHHGHRVDGTRKVVFSKAPKDRAGAARRALEELEALGYVAPAGRVGRASSFRVTDPGFAAAFAGQTIRAEREGAALDPERQYEAAMASRERQQSLLPTAAPDMSFDFGSNLNPGLTPQQAMQILQAGGFYNRAGRWQPLTERQASYMRIVASGRSWNRNPLLALVGMGNPCCGSCARGGPCEIGHNPLLALVGMGNPGVGDNPTDSTKRGDRHFVGYVTIESAHAYARQHGKLAEFEKARRDYIEFHGVEPKRLALYRIPTSGGGTQIDFGAALGRVSETRYLTSNNGGSKDAAKEWRHPHPAGGRPLEVKLARTGLTTKVGGTYSVTDWWRD